MNNKTPDEKPVIICGKSKTKQSFREAANINNMVARFKKSGVFDDVTTKIAQYADLSSPITYHEACQQVIKAEEQFNALPAHVRLRFNNNPAELLDFAIDEKNNDEAIKLGLIKPPKNQKSSASQKETKKTGDQDPADPESPTEPEAKDKPKKPKK